MDASMLAQPLPIQSGPPATPEEMQNRTQQWLQVIQSPTVQQELQKYKAMQGLMGFGTRMTQNIGMGVPGTAAFGNAVGHGMDVMGDIDREMLKNSMGLAKQQAGEDEARMQRMQVGQQQGETGRHNKEQERLTARGQDLQYKQAQLYAGRGGGGAAAVTPAKYSPEEYLKFYALLEKSIPSTDEMGNPIPGALQQKKLLMDQWLAQFQPAGGQPTLAPKPGQAPITAESIVAEQNREFAGKAPSKAPTGPEPSLMEKARSAERALTDATANLPGTLKSVYDQGVDWLSGTPIGRGWQLKNDPVAQEILLKLQRGVPLDPESQAYMMQYSDVLEPWAMQRLGPMP